MDKAGFVQELGELMNAWTDGYIDYLELSEDGKRVSIRYGSGDTGSANVDGDDIVQTMIDVGFAVLKKAERSKKWKPKKG